jgi:hypothetical protein
VNRVEFSKSAALDVRSAQDWYEQQEPGLSVHFLNAMDEPILQLSRFPAMAVGMKMFDVFRFMGSQF